MGATLIRTLRIIYPQMRKWMGVKLKPLCVRSGPLADRAIRTFRVGHPAMTPVMLPSNAVVTIVDAFVCFPGFGDKL